jgi:hypothetical protein
LFTSLFSYLSAFLSQYILVSLSNFIFLSLILSILDILTIFLILCVFVCLLLLSFFSLLVISHVTLNDVAVYETACVVKAELLPGVCLPSLSLFLFLSLSLSLSYSSFSLKPNLCNKQKNRRFLTNNLESTLQCLLLSISDVEPEQFVAKFGSKITFWLFCA